MPISRQSRLAILGTATTGLFLAEIVVGYLTQSVALVADSFHMLSDVLSMAVAWYTIRLAARTTYGSNYTFGFQRAEILGALINGVFLLALCFSIFIEAIQRFFEPHTIDDPKLVLIVGACGLAVNVIGLGLFHEHGHSHGHSHDHSHSHTPVPTHPSQSRANIMSLPTTPSPTHSHTHQTMNMRAVFLHLLSDALGSLAVILTAILNLLLPTSSPILPYIDPIASLLITILITISTLPLIKSASRVLLQSSPLGVDMELLKREVENVEGVLGVHDFHVWQLSEVKWVASVHLLVDKSRGEEKGFMGVAGDVKRVLHAYGIHSATVQPEFIKSPPSQSSTPTPTEDELEEMGHGEMTCLLSCVEASCREQVCCPSPAGDGTQVMGTVDSVLAGDVVVVDMELGRRGE